MKFVGRRPTLQREMSEQSASLSKSPGASRECPGPLAPLFTVETLKRCGGLCLELCFTLQKIVLKGMRCQIVGLRQFLNPLHHHLNIAQFPQITEQTPARFFHLFPALIRVKRHQTVGHRTASSQGNSQIMYWIRSKSERGAITFLEHALHPVTQSKLARRFLRGG